MSGIATRFRRFAERVLSYIDARRPLRVLWHTGNDFLDDGCLDNAAALAFYALLSFIPFLIIVGAVIGIVIDRFAGTTPPAELIESAKEYLKTFIPYLQDDLLHGFLSLSRHTASLSTIGLVSLAISASLLFSTLSTTIAHIFGTKPVNFVLTRLIGVVIIVATTILLFFLHYFAALVFSLAGLVRDHFPYLQKAVSLLTGNGLLWSIFLITMFIVVLFVLLLRVFAVSARIPFVPILWGALSFSLLWNGAKYLFNIYITKLSSYSIIYGSATWFAAAILWVYYSMTLLLLAMELIKAIHREHNRNNTMGGSR